MVSPQGQIVEPGASLCKPYQTVKLSKACDKDCFSVLQRGCVHLLKAVSEVLHYNG